MLIWIDGRFFCGGVEYDDRTMKITKAPPIVKKFVGQNIENLLGWLKQNRNLREYHIFREQDSPIYHEDQEADWSRDDGRQEGS